MEIGSRVRSRREELRLTQEELARELGVTHQHVSRIEAGQAAPSLELLVKLSRAFGVSADFLLTGEPEPALSVAAAIRADALLSAGVKQHLIGIIEVLRSSGERA